jgi:hypothetical protein
MQFLHVLDLFLVRMFKYLSDGWITRPDTIEIAKAEHKKAFEWFLRMSDDQIMNSDLVVSYLFRFTTL